MNFENLSTSTDPTNPILTAPFTTGNRIFEADCNNVLDKGTNFHIMQGNTCFTNTSDPSINWNYRNDPQAALTDHTTGTGKWLEAWNPTHDASCANTYLETCYRKNELIWQKTARVNPNTWYEFSYWVLLNDYTPNWWAGSSQYQFSGGTPSGPINSGVTTNDKWTKVIAGWNSGNQTSVTIQLIYVPKTSGASGITSDAFMGIDDIDFRQSCCVPITAETFIESQRVCSTTNTVCKLKAVTSKSFTNICLIDGAKSLFEPVEELTSADIMDPETEVAPATHMYVSPNPFHGSTSIEYQLHKTSLVQLEVFNMMGQKIETFVNTDQTEGEYKYLLSITEEEKNSSGMYYVKMTIDGISEIKKIVRIK